MKFDQSDEKNDIGISSTYNRKCPMHIWKISRQRRVESELPSALRWSASSETCCCSNNHFLSSNVRSHLFKSLCCSSTSTQKIHDPKKRRSSKVQHRATPKRKEVSFTNIMILTWLLAKKPRDKWDKPHSSMALLKHFFFNQKRNFCIRSGWFSNFVVVTIPVHCPHEKINP